MTQHGDLLLELAGLLENLGGVSSRLDEAVSESPAPQVVRDLAPLYESWSHVPSLRTAFGTALTSAVAQERKLGSSRIIHRLAGEETAGAADEERKVFVVVNTRMLGTWVTILRGTQVVDKVFVHNRSDRADGPVFRAEAVAEWLEPRLEELGKESLAAMGCRGGFMGAVTCGTYLATEEMLSDLGRATVEHHSNLALLMVPHLKALGVIPEVLPVAVTDPVSCDELESVERLTGYLPVARDGTGAHYLNHRGCHQLVASVMGREPGEVSAVTLHLGAGNSVALHRDGMVQRLVDTFSGIPSANRSGALDVASVLQGLSRGDFDLKELDEAVFRAGGLMSLAGTDDFEALLGFRQAGATAMQAEKIDAILAMLVRRAGAAVGAVVQGIEDPVPLLVVTGPVVRSPILRNRLLEEFGSSFPIVVVPGSLENEALAAGALRALYAPDSCKDYVVERDRVAAGKSALMKMWHQPVFERPLRYRVPGAPIRGIDELIDSAFMVVRGGRLPTVAIVGAANEAAVLAAKHANERGRYRLARFVLLDDYESVSSLAYDYDLVLDGVNYAIEDTEDPVVDAVRLLDEGRVDILMKGRLKTEEILRGVFSYLKRSGRLSKGQVVSHVVTIDIPTRPKLVLITDGAVNPYPDEERKIAILENALTVAASLHIPRPKVAVLSAIESVNPSVDSSLEARRIAERMAGRDDCIVEGPLSFDVAMDADVAREKGYKGEIQGDADILLMPDIDAGNVVYKALTTQSGATVAGVILCGDMPMVLTSRGDSARSKLASIAQAVKLWSELSGGGAD